MSTISIIVVRDNCSFEDLRVASKELMRKLHELRKASGVTSKENQDGKSYFCLLLGDRLPCYDLYGSGGENDCKNVVRFKAKINF